MTTSTLMTVVMNSMSLRCRETKHALKRTFIQENAYLILLHGCSLVEDLNNFRLCGSAASHPCLMQTRNFQLLNTWHENFDF